MSYFWSQRRLLSLVCWRIVTAKEVLLVFDSQGYLRAELHFCPCFRAKGLIQIFRL